MSCTLVNNLNHLKINGNEMTHHLTHEEFKANPQYSYDIVYSTPTAATIQAPAQMAPVHHNRFESPVRDNYRLAPLEKESKYKDHYGVSDFKFSDIATTVSRRSNHVNFCELSFDGTKSTKHHHHRKKNIVKRVTSTTTINYLAQKDTTDRQFEEQQLQQEPPPPPPPPAPAPVEKVKEATFHHLAEQLKNKLKFIEMPVLLHKQVVVNKEEATNRFEVILSPKPPTSYSSIETMLKASEHHHKKIIVASAQLNRPNMRDREIQTAIIGIRNFHNSDECYNMRLSTVNDIFYNVNFLSSNDDNLLPVKQKKQPERKPLTVTHFPCLEIKCSSIFFEMSANAVRPPMPRRTLNTSNTILEDYQEQSTTIDEKISEPTVTVNSSLATEPLKNRIMNLLNGTQIAMTVDYNKKVNELCELIGSLLPETSNKINTQKKKKRPADMYLNIKRMKVDEVPAPSVNKRQTVVPVPYARSKTYCTTSASEKSCDSNSVARGRTRSISPPSRPSTPSCQISKVPAAESNTQIDYEQDGFCSKTCPNLLDDINQKYSLTSIPSKSSRSNMCQRFESPMKAAGDKILTNHQFIPKEVFTIPARVNKMLNPCEYTSNAIANEFQSSTRSSLNNPNLVNILKKPPAKPPWLVSNDYVTKMQKKCDVVNNFQCMANTKPKKGEHENIGPSVTFSPMVDVFGDDNDNESFEENGYSPNPNPPQINMNSIVPVIELSKSKPPPIKLESVVVNNVERLPQTSGYQQGVFVGRPYEPPKPHQQHPHQQHQQQKPTNDKEPSFFNSNIHMTKKDLAGSTATANTTPATTAASCLQKRKEYDHKLKMQKQVKQQQQSKIPTYRGNDQHNDTTSSNKIDSFKMTKSKLPLTIGNNKFSQQIKSGSSKKADSQLSTPRSAKGPRPNYLSKDVLQNVQKMRSSL